MQQLPNVLLGLDFGLRCIGVAVGQRVTGHAKPLTVLKAQQGIPDWSQLKQLCQEWMVKGFVVGLATGNNVPASFQQATQHFAQQLEQQFNLPVFFVDEHFTTAIARQQNKNRSKQHQRHDDLAAQLILQSWLDQHQEG